MNVIQRACEIHRKKKRGEQLTLDEQMIYDIVDELTDICEVLVDCSKKNISCDISIERIRRHTDIVNKEYEEESYTNL